jgi:hypothetical protein
MTISNLGRNKLFLIKRTIKLISCGKIIKIKSIYSFLCVYATSLMYFYEVFLKYNKENYKKENKKKTKILGGRNMSEITNLLVISHCI